MPVTHNWAQSFHKVVSQLHFVAASWEDAENAEVLKTLDDINSNKDLGLLEVSIAKPMNADHIVNCPFIDPFQ